LYAISGIIGGFYTLIRKAEKCDASRIAEILVFSKRVNYRKIFHNDAYSFGELQVVPIAEELCEDEHKLDNIWVYDDGFVKGMIHVENGEIIKLYVDSFFTGEGIGAELIQFAVDKLNATYLWALEKNDGAIRFYNRHGFTLTGEKIFEEGTPEYLVKLRRQ